LCERIIFSEYLDCCSLGFHFHVKIKSFIKSLFELYWGEISCFVVTEFQYLFVGVKFDRQYVIFDQVSIWLIQLPTIYYNFASSVWKGNVFNSGYLLVMYRFMAFVGFRYDSKSSSSTAKFLYFDSVDALGG